ncbi:MAG: hypothetical protein ABIK08_15125 [Pseudomonadota bacterium]
MDETQGKVRHLSLALTRVAGVALAIFFILIAIDAAPALVIGAALAGTALLVLVFMPLGVYEMETCAMARARPPGIPAPRAHQETEPKAFEPILASPPPRPAPVI